MPYVRRDATGQLIALSSEEKARLQESDRDVVRVLDDLVNLLIDKNLIRFTDLPAAAQRKLIERRGLRETGSHLGLLGDDTSLL